MYIYIYIYIYSSRPALQGVPDFFGYAIAIAAMPPRDDESGRLSATRTSSHSAISRMRNSLSEFGRLHCQPLHVVSLFASCSQRRLRTLSEHEWCRREQAPSWEGPDVRKPHASISTLRALFDMQHSPSRAELHDLLQEHSSGQCNDDNTNHTHTS